MLTNVKDVFGNIKQLNLENSDYMTSDDLISWYMTHVNHNITKSFLGYLNDLGILESKYSIKDSGEALYSLKKLNSIMLERVNDDYVKTDSGDYKMKSNRYCIIEKFKKTTSPNVIEKENNSKTVEGNIKFVSDTKSKFKIEHIGGNKLKLHRIK